MICKEILKIGLIRYAKPVLKVGLIRYAKPVLKVGLIRYAKPVITHDHAKRAVMKQICDNFKQVNTNLTTFYAERM